MGRLAGPVFYVHVFSLIGTLKAGTKISYSAGAGKVMRPWGQRQLPVDLVNFTVCIMSNFLQCGGGEGDASLGTEAAAGRFSLFYNVYVSKFLTVRGRGR